MKVVTIDIDIVVITTPARQPKIILISGLTMQFSSMPTSALEGRAQERMSAT